LAPSEIPPRSACFPEYSMLARSITAWEVVQ
jgi:hypothetical protein